MLQVWGEEFVLLLPGTGLANSKDVAERIRYAVSSTQFLVGRNEIRITTSLGVVQVDPRDADLAALLARADQALYRAKLAGRNQVSI